MYRCSNCGLLVGPDDATEVDEPSRPCPKCAPLLNPKAGENYDEWPPYAMDWPEDQP